ncbi:hypothetical protein BHE74_00040610 [Ensete ventricosum]|nr:hypothetical protein BHE74_00040610 [Ensete ventricosum]RZR92291.1 hypothetical protein BHM03_00020562 [Ensete ventricosum]
MSFDLDKVCNIDGYRLYRAVHIGSPTNSRLLLSGGNDRFRLSLADFGWYQLSGKEEEGEEKGELGDPAPLSRPRSVAETLQGDFYSLRKLFGEISSPRTGFSGRRHFFSLHWEKKRLLA